MSRYFFLRRLCLLNGVVVRNLPLNRYVLFHHRSLAHIGVCLIFTDVLGGCGSFMLEGSLFLEFIELRQFLRLPAVIILQLRLTIWLQILKLDRIGGRLRVHKLVRF